MFHDGETGEQHVVLRTEAQRVPGCLHVSLDVVSVDPGLSAGGGEQSCQHGHCRRLPCPIVAQQSRDLALKGVEGDAGHSYDLPPGTEDLPEVDHLHSLLLVRFLLEEKFVPQLSVVPAGQLRTVSAPVGSL